MNDFNKSLPLVVLVIVLIVCSFQQQLKDNQPWRRYGSVILGIIFIIWGLVSIGTGRITAWRRQTQTYLVTRDPVGFWVVTAFVIVLGIGCVVRGIKGRK